MTSSRPSRSLAARTAGMRRSLCAGEVLAWIEKVDDLTVTFTLRAPLAELRDARISAPGSRARRPLTRPTRDSRPASRPCRRRTPRRSWTTSRPRRGSPPARPATTEMPTVDYGRFRADGEALLTKAGVPLPTEAMYTADGDLDVDGYVRDLTSRVRAVDATFTARPIDALAAAYPFLDVQAATGRHRPVPPRCHRSGRGARAGRERPLLPGRPRDPAHHLPDHRGPAAAGQALADGDIDWQPALPAPVFEEIRDDPDLSFVEYHEPSFLGLVLQPAPRIGRPVRGSRNLRQAVSYCFDKPGTAEQATEGGGAAIYSEIPPVSWAYPTTGLNLYPLDPARAKELIEAAGWKLGDDGIYAKDGRRLSTTVAVRAGFPERTRWLELVAEQVRACGIELRVAEVPFGAIVRMLDVYPHINAAAPDSRRPFDAYLGGFNTTPEPDPFRLPRRVRVKTSTLSSDSCLFSRSSRSSKRAVLFSAETE